MNVYYLCPANTAIVHPMDNCLGTSHRVKVRGAADWYAARLRALQHAAEAGARHALVVCGHAEPVQVVHPDGRRDSRPQAASLGAEGDHGLLLYLQRLLRQHAGAVLLGPLGAMGQLRAMEDFHPVLPSVAAYLVAAALGSAEADGPGLELDLCQHGYRVITLGDYLCRVYGDPTLDTTGTTTSWRRANANALKGLL